MNESTNKLDDVAYSESFFNARDGIRLFFRHWQVPQAKGMVAMVHGYCEHCGRYDEVAQALNSAGWSAAALDLRGHGQSGGRRAHVDRFSEYINDVHSFLDEIEQTGCDQKPILLGHSMGGLIAARFAQLAPERMSHLVLSSPFIGLALKVPAAKVMMGKLVSRLMPTFSMPSGLDPELVSHDEVVVKEYGSDPMISHHATARWFTETTQAQEECMMDAGRLTSPVLIMQAGDDRVVSRQMTEQLHSGLASADKTLKIYEGYYHEIFNEIDRQQVFADLCSWLDKHSK